MEIRDGILYFDGCNTVELAREYGTPLYLVSESIITQKCRELRDCFLSRYDKTRAAYAGKAYLTLSMCRIIEREGLSLDVVSGGELFTAIRAEFPAERIEFNGNNKSREEIEMAVDYGVGRIILDGLQELPLLEAVCMEKNKWVNVLIRINPNVDSHTHTYLTTGTSDSKFGISLEEDTIFPAVKAAIDSQYLHFAGLHFHIGSQIFDRQPYLLALDAALDLAKEIKKRYDCTIEELNIGGGYAVRYVPEDESRTWEYYLTPIMEKIEAFFQQENMVRPIVVIEPGRSIAADAGMSIYTVGGIKEVNGIRKYISVDGGMTDNPRPALYGARYDGILANKADKPKHEKAAICGKCCESGDILIRELDVAEAERGDILAVFKTGAYCYAMANNYNKSPFPAMVLLKNGESQLIVKRQSYENLISNEVLPAEENPCMMNRREGAK